MTTSFSPCAHGRAASRIIFNDPRRFGFMLLADEASLDSHPMLAGLGIEPTGNALSGKLISDLFRGRGRRSRRHCSTSA